MSSFNTLSYLNYYFYWWWMAEVKTPVKMGSFHRVNIFNISAKLNFDDVLWLVVFFWQYKNEASFEETTEK